MAEERGEQRQGQEELIFEMHRVSMETRNMLATFIERLDNHITCDDAHHKEEKLALSGFDIRLVPVEKFQERCTFAGKVIATVVVAIPTVVAAGMGVWEFVKKLSAAARP